MNKLRDWWGRRRRQHSPRSAPPARGGSAAPSSEDDGLAAAPAWSDSKPAQPDATEPPYGPHNDRAARHDAEGAEHTHDMGGTGHHQGASQALPPGGLDGGAGRA
jgi:hypothetical protein